MKTYTMEKIGQQIHNVLTEKGLTARWLAAAIQCERTNVYDIFKRDDINIMLLARISHVLDHDFFLDISRELHNNNGEWL